MRSSPSLGKQVTFGPGHGLRFLRSDLRGLQIHLVDGVDDDAADEGPRCVLVVSRHHVPRSPRGGSGGQSLLVGGLVLVPIPSLRQVARGELPVFGGVLESLEKSFLLLLAER